MVLGTRGRTGLRRQILGSTVASVRGDQREARTEGGFTFVFGEAGVEVDRTAANLKNKIDLHRHLPEWVSTIHGLACSEITELITAYQPRPAAAEVYEIGYPKKGASAMSSAQSTSPDPRVMTPTFQPPIPQLDLIARFTVELAGEPWELAPNLS